MNERRKRSVGRIMKKRLDLRTFSDIQMKIIYYTYNGFHPNFGLPLRRDLHDWPLQTRHLFQAKSQVR